jgi:hypothetical protein
MDRRDYILMKLAALQVKHYGDIDPEFIKEAYFEITVRDPEWDYLTPETYLGIGALGGAAVGAIGGALGGIPVGALLATLAHRNKNKDKEKERR